LLQGYLTSNVKENKLPPSSSIAAAIRTMVQEAGALRKDGPSNDTAALRASTHSEPSSSKKPSKPPSTPCSNCGRKGHTKESCWAKGGGKEGKGPA
jgi:hypothetical protein